MPRLANLRFLFCSLTLWYALLAACTPLGPESISAGRLSYVEAISATNQQQILLAVVRNRYDEHGVLLAVDSITANIRFTANSAVQAGIGDSDNFQGNLVPFSAGVQYEENPTITYTPVSGERYMRRVMYPIPLSRFALLAQNLAEPAYVYESLVAGVNGIRNPAFATDTSSGEKFQQFVQILTELKALGSLQWTVESDASATLAINRADPHSSRLADKLVNLLQLDDPPAESGWLELPVVLAVDGHGDNAIGITTRSLWGLLDILSAAVEAPETDSLAGITAEYSPLAGPAAGLSVKYSVDEPTLAAVAVPYRGGWFFIDDGDRHTKRVFRLLEALWNSALSEDSGKNTPVLTIPVSQ